MISFVEFQTNDGVHLTGLLHHSGNRTVAALIVHGAAMEATSGPSLWLSKGIAVNGVDCLAINMRSHGLAYVEQSFRRWKGWAWQTHESNMTDVRAGIDHLRALGYAEVILVGHSWGGLVCAHAASLAREEVSGLVLLSPIDTYDRVLRVNLGDNYSAALAVAAELVRIGRESTMLLTTPSAPIPAISAAAVVELAAGRGALDELLGSVSLPVLILIGDREPQGLKENAQGWSTLGTSFGPVELQVLAEAGHFYQGTEHAVITRIGHWISKYFELRTEER